MARDRIANSVQRHEANPGVVWVAEPRRQTLGQSVVGSVDGEVSGTPLWNRVPESPRRGVRIETARAICLRVPIRQPDVNELVRPWERTRPAVAGAFGRVT